ncbi:putative calcineurin is a calcium-dependent protein [Phytophthora infestans]|uniref:Putative calcineurin is a calcium-dependent protein n=1 Tax=Phytophthora infestans TaxID=4787 RepID=A0A8S9TZY9_PHYIN|nr:putative calcineurin is a calcium-dependent protein [Phytophthora infestans]
MTTNASASTVSNPALADDEEYSDDGFDSQNLRYNCNQLRAKIREFLGEKEMTLKEFLEECQVNPGSYYRFMELNGRDRGAGNTTYYGASRFFYRRDRRAKIEKRKQKANDKKRKASEHREEKAKKARDGLDLLKRIQETVLGDEDENGFPPVYDDCDEIRKKISEFQGEKIVTQAAFLKAMGNVSANSLRSFMSMKRGAGSGAANVVYRKGYVFFEKKRTLEGGNKTKKRLENEKKQGPDGFELRHDDGKRYYLVSELQQTV